MRCCRIVQTHRTRQLLFEIESSQTHYPNLSLSCWLAGRSPSTRTPDLQQCFLTSFIITHRITPYSWPAIRFQASPRHHAGLQASAQVSPARAAGTGEQAESPARQAATIIRDEAEQKLFSPYFYCRCIWCQLSSVSSPCIGGQHAPHTHTDARHLD